jgi:hypothetical protein
MLTDLGRERLDGIRIGRCRIDLHTRILSRAVKV